MISATAQGSGRRQVVLVEDDEPLRRVLSFLLESAGWEVLEAADGRVGLTLVMNAVPDLVITDLRLPGLSGIDLARSLESVPTGRRVPIVAITSDTSALREAAMRSRCFVSVLSKPLVPSVFLSKCRRALGPHTGES